MKKGKGETDEEVSIPELDAIVASGTHKQWNPWTPREDAIVTKYYNKVDIEDLVKHLPGRTSHSIRARAKQIGAATKIRDIRPLSGTPAE